MCDDDLDNEAYMSWIMVAERELRLDDCHFVHRPHTEGEYHAVAYDHDA